ncbi:MAG: GNAT family N-acetyltransferase [Planctomycetes bacterium]|nr:GNAT family N-acetyltransferase [Planctomycetota bacterium]
MTDKKLVAVLMSAIAKNSGADEQDSVITSKAILAALAEIGCRGIVVELTTDVSRAEAELRRLKPDVVFNIVDTVAGRGCYLPLAPALLENLGIPYAGESASSLNATTNKVFSKRIMRQGGIQTPAWFVPGEGLTGNVHFPARFIGKSVWEHASIGIDDESVREAEGDDDLLALVRRAEEKTNSSSFAEEFIDGREFNVSLLSIRGVIEVLPIAEMTFRDYDADKLKIVHYDAKWNEDAPEYHRTVRTFDFPKEDALLLSKLRRAAMSCAEIFGLRSYSRVDFRVDEGGRVFVLEINANPGIAPDSGFISAAERRGLSYADVVREIIAEAESREPKSRIESRESEVKKLDPRSSILDPSENRKSPEISFRLEVRADDLEAVRGIVASSGYFYAEEIDIAVELVQEKLDKGAESTYEFVFAEIEGRVAGYTCFGRIPGAAGSFDLYWIAVDQSIRGAGVGGKLMKRTEKEIANLGGRRAFLQTSSRDLYESTRGFYIKMGWTLVATLDEYYDEGDSQLVYSKRLASV